MLRDFRELRLAESFDASTYLVQSIFGLLGGDNEWRRIFSCLGENFERKKVKRALSLDVELGKRGEGVFNVKLAIRV